MADQRFPAEHRLRRSDDFQRVYQQRLTASDGCLLVFGAANGLPHPRLGLSVSRKVGNSVVRHRWKRLVREAFRLAREQIPAGLDLIVIPRAAEQPALADLMRSLPQLAKRIHRRLRT